MGNSGSAPMPTPDAAGAPAAIGNLGGSAGAPLSSSGAGAAGSVGAVSEGGSAGDARAEPTLNALSASLGVLIPGFDPQEHDYRLDLALLDSSVRFSASAEPGSSITVNGEPLDASSSALVELDAAGNKVEFVVTRNGTSSAYAVDVRRSLDLTRSAFVKQFDVSSFAMFGGSVAIAEDTLVVGRDESVDIFKRWANTWTPAAHLTGAMDTPAHANFGGAVALSGDTLVVSAQFAGKNDGSGGAAYVFTRADQAWTPSAYLKIGSSDNPNPTGFGASVAVYGDLIAIGAPYDSSNATGINGDESNTLAESAGAVYVFRRNGDAWIQEAYLKASNTKTDARFGASVALSAHGLAVGSPGESASGAVYLFADGVGIWSQQTYFKASNADSGDGFGASVAFDGFTLVVGAPQEAGSLSGVSAKQADNAVSASGAAYVFQSPAGAWQEVGYLKSAKPARDDRFGSSVALAGRTVAVGDWPLSTLDGSVYLFAPSASEWSMRGRVTASMARSSGFQHGGVDQFGRAIALSSTTLVVGAPYEVEPQGALVGTVYSFE